MDPLPKKNNITESIIQTKVIQGYILEGWYCVRTHGNAYQSGFPDVFLCNKRFGSRWVEVKRPGYERFTQAQLDVFTQFAKKRIGVWVVTDHDPQERHRIFRPSNWYTYLHKCRKGIHLNDTIERRKKFGPEGIIQDAIINKLTKEEWFCLETYGSVYQTGLPDLYCCHEKYGARWIEVKNPEHYVFTPSQVDLFPHFASQGVGIWVLTSVDETHKIFESPNWYTFLWK
jgi:hypothetical protein